MFHIPRLQFLLVYSPRVATISFDQKRERGFDEQLVHILKFKQKYWASLVVKMGQLQTCTHTSRGLAIIESVLWALVGGKKKLGKYQKTSFTSYFLIYLL